MYDKERMLALIDEANRLTAALKVETQEIGCRKSRRRGGDARLIG